MPLNAGKSWLPLERNAEGQVFRPICPPLVAPDQRSMAIAARRGAAPTGADDVIDLWWIALNTPKPRTAPPPS
jgi:hypothetical protein